MATVWREEKKQPCCQSVSGRELVGGVFAQKQGKTGGIRGRDSLQGNCSHRILLLWREPGGILLSYYKSQFLLRKKSKYFPYSYICLFFSIARDEPCHICLGPQ